MAVVTAVSLPQDAVGASGMSGERGACRLVVRHAPLAHCSSRFASESVCSHAASGFWTP
jgi:hypothetical protein